MTNLLQAMDDARLFGQWFKGACWQAWKVFLTALFALAMPTGFIDTYHKHTGRTTLPASPSREAWLIVGRRGGKSLISALVAVFLATFRDYTPYLAPGEVATVMIIATDRRQAKVVMRYINGFLDNIGMLSSLVTNRTQESIELNNRVVIEVHTCSFRAVRGYTIAACIADEIAFWRSDESANPDTEVIAAIRPALTTIPGSLLLCITSPYARRGAVWEAHKKHFGINGDPILVWQGSTLEMNPNVDPEFIQQAYEEDPQAAAAEFGAEFRPDLDTYVPREVVEGCVGDYIERAYDGKYQYRAFVDVAGGSGQDSYTLAIAHDEKDLMVIDAIRETRPRFNPEDVTDEYCRLLNSYRIRFVTGDRYAGSWPAEQFRKRSITYKTSEKSKSELYVDSLPVLNAGRVTIPNSQRLVAQLCGLERRTGRGTGRDIVDHGPNGHDDVANVVAGVLAGSSGKKPVINLRNWYEERQRKNG
jgi:hypothetical protein